jgi:hypothetical protein
MGVFGTGLYSGDFAMDMRSAIRAVARLPFDPDRLVDILSETEPAAAQDPGDTDHTTFWLVVADQFARRGIACERARDKALGIIDSGSDIAMLTKLGMSASDLKKRQAMLLELRLRLVTAPPDGKPRDVLKKPQPFLMDVGDVLVYPTFRGKNINPYFASREKQICHTEQGPSPWRADGWSALLVVDRGRAFDFLSWYRPLTISAAMPEKPTLAALSGELLWKLERPGVCSAVHFRRMELEKIGALPVDEARLKRAFPDMRPGISQAINDISIANSLNVGPSFPAELMPRPGEVPAVHRGKPFPTILGVGQLLR